MSLLPRSLRLLFTEHRYAARGRTLRQIRAGWSP